MGAVGVLLIGVGAWLMFEAWKNASPTPLVNAKASLTAASNTQSFPSNPPGSSIA